MSKRIVSAHITDVHADLTTNTFYYPVYTMGGIDDYKGVLEGITLFTKTARTNVCFKGADGKFVSYHNLQSQAVRNAMEALKPFPEA